MTATIVLLVIAGVALYLLGEQLLRIGGAAVMALALFHGFVVLDEPGLITLGTFRLGPGAVAGRSLDPHDPPGRVGLDRRRGPAVPDCPVGQSAQR
jgi:hypothetical protein